MHAGFDISKTSVVCAGGIGGSQIFVDVAKSKLYPTPEEALKYFVPVEPMIAQTSIPKGGVYLAEEKDHVNFNA